MERADREERWLLRKVWTDCWTNLTGLLGANLLCLLWCLPSGGAALLSLPRMATGLAIVTVGPAVLGLLTYAAHVAREQPASIWRDSLRGFRSAYRTGVIAGAVMATALTAHRLALTHAIEAKMAAGAVAVWAAQVALLIVLVLSGVHALSLVSLYQQDIKEAFRNALVLTIAHPVPTVGLAAAGVLAVLMTRALLGAPLIILPALLAVLATNTTLTLAQQHAVAQH